MTTMTDKEMKLLKMLAKKDKKKRKREQEDSSSISQLSDADDLETKLINDVRGLAKEKLQTIEKQQEKKREIKQLDKQRVKANIKSERGELSDSNEEEEAKEPGMVEAGKDKEGNAMFDLN